VRGWLAVFAWCAPLAAAACWRAPHRAPAEATAAAPAARCEIRDADIETADSVQLAVEGQRFALIGEELTRFDVVIDGARARAQLETSELELTGELSLAQLSLRTRGETLHDGWVAIRDAHARRAVRDLVEIEVAMPAWVVPEQIVATLGCRAVTFARRPYAEDAADDTDDTAPEPVTLAFAPGTRTPLARTPGGPALVFLVPGDEPPELGEEPLRAHVLERRGAFARVEVEGRNVITGWVPTQHAREVTGEVLGGLFGFGRSGKSYRLVHCTHDVPIYVTVATQLRRVGRYKPGAVIRYAGPAIDDDAGDRMLVVDLGADELPPRVERADLVDCTPGAP
jgi:hypothetical protein